MVSYGLILEWIFSDLAYFGLSFVNMWGKVACPQKNMFWMLSMPGQRWMGAEKFSLRNAEWYLQALDGIKKTSTASVYGASWLAKNSYSLCDVLP